MNKKKKDSDLSITLSHLTVKYGAHVALENVSGTFLPGSLTAIIGPNGSGKSTMLKAMMGLVKPSKGNVTPGYACLRRNVAYLPQQAEIDRTFPLRVEDFVATGYWRTIGSFAGISDAQHAKVHEKLTYVGLAGFEHRTLDALSGGQFQRVLFARLMVQDAPLIFLDEPFTGVDQRTISELTDLIFDWYRQGKTVVTVLHDLDLVRARFPETVLLDQRVLDWGETKKVLEHKALWNIPLCNHEGGKTEERAPQNV